MSPDQEEIDAAIYEKMQPIGGQSSAPASIGTPSLQMMAAPDQGPDIEDDVDPISIDTSSQLLDAILQELRSLNQNIREIM
jgi:hypothetical protein